ncbi:Tox-REase-5 domain-containing protein [Corallococcus sp. BB11-1]|uniref:SitA5 family polymorphic toxin n=1 Tax=Corallococcus sp. BB11-1 TaxID=2996783 RepID=UPI002271A87A|nr:Tox-REase-5 domain-containing protein [Corallococcus sp. BB11-1]MCY1029927.1 Tox-REase-5 domain-containing protein [Corallococcus sp. BB11-1]
MDVRRSGVWMLVLVLVTGCASGPTVRLRTGDGQVRTYTPRTSAQRIPIQEGAFKEALAQLVLDVPLTVRPSRLGRVVRARTGDGALMDEGLGFLLRDRYGKWCRAHEAPVDCLSLLEQGMGFSAMDRLTFAVGMSLDPLRESLADAVDETLDPAFFVSVVVGALTSWVVLAAAPDPVFTKAAAVLAAVVLAYLGIESFLAVVRACGALKTATDRAMTFQELEEAGETFGRTLGPEVARLFVLAVTVLVSHGVTVGMTSALTLLPGFTDAAMLGASRVGFNVAAVERVSAVAVVGGTVELTLVPTAVSMAAMGPPSGGAPGGLPSGGPGKWVQVNESMSDRARAYQAQVTGAPEGSAYRMQDGDMKVDFDGFNAKEDMLLEAKGPGYEAFIKSDTEMKEFFQGLTGVVEQARNQFKLARGRRIRWIVAEKRFADILRKTFTDYEFDNIEVVHVPPAR